MNLIKPLNLAILILSGSFFLEGCGSLTPTINERSTIAYSANERTAGIIEELPSGALKINQDAYQRYSALIKLYGEKTTPRTAQDYGIDPLENGFYSLTREGAERWYMLKIFQYNDEIDSADKDTLVKKIGL